MAIFASVDSWEYGLYRDGVSLDFFLGKQKSSHNQPICTMTGISNKNNPFYI